MTLEEIAAARVWLDGYTRHLTDYESRTLRDDAFRALQILAEAAQGAERDVERNEATYARCRAELEQRIARRPPPTTTPQALQEGWFLPLNRQRALGVSVSPRVHVPRVHSRFNVFGYRWGRA